MILRRFLLVASALLVALTSVCAHAADADRPLRIVVPYAPGGSSDVLARLLVDRLREALGQPIVIENRPGAGSMLGTDVVAKAKPDGATVLLADMPHTIVPAVHGARTPYHPLDDFAPITLIGVAPLFLFVNAGFAAQTLTAFIAQAKSAPQTIAIASGGNGSATHLMAALFQAQAGISLTHVPYKGAGPALADVAAGQVPASFTTLPTAAPHLKAGRLVALGVTAPTRLPDFPSVPTFAEIGLPAMTVQHWWGVLAPARMPEAGIERLSRAIVGAMASADVRERFVQAGVTAPPATGPAALRSLIETDSARWAAVVRDARITAE